MDDTVPTDSSTTTDLHKAASTSSTPTAESPPADTATELGERVLAELGDRDTNNTLVRWLAHHTARLLESADHARAAGDADADNRAAEARAAILQLWQARSNWPAGWPPPRAAEVARILQELPGLDEPVWYRTTLPARLQDLHHHVLGALVDLVMLDSEADIEQQWLSAFGDRLSPEEATLLRLAAETPRRLDALRRWWDRVDTERETDATEHHDAPYASEFALHVLIELADLYRDTIVELVGRATTPNQNRDVEPPHSLEEAPASPDSP